MKPRYVIIEEIISREIGKKLSLLKFLNMAKTPE